MKQILDLKCSNGISASTAYAALSDASSFSKPIVVLIDAKSVKAFELESRETVVDDLVDLSRQLAVKGRAQ